MKKLILLSYLCIVANFMSAQTVKTDTIFPYKILSDDGQRGKTILSGNTTVPYSFSSAIIFKVFEKAIEGKNTVVVTYDPVTLMIKKAKTLHISDQGAFIFKHNSLNLAGFKFDEEISFNANEHRLLNELNQETSSLKQFIPTDSISLIFKYFQSLSCEQAEGCNRGNPCISFDYKIDGCYARAHLMRKILAEKFGYDCQKIFVEGKLRAINTGACGGQCVQWGWHVALNVKTTDVTGTLTDLVIDPSLFDRACSINEWTTAQGASCCPTCKPGNPATPYLKPSFVYTPNGSTDDNYSRTLKILYKYCKECH